MGDRALHLTEAEYDLVIAALKFSAHILRQRGGNWRRFHELADQLALRCPSADSSAEAQRQTQHVTIREAAVRLNCTTRHARRLAPRLGGHQLADRTWLIPAEAL
jgi:hypothetical protein